MKKLSRLLRESIGFLLTFLLIFGVTFAVMNFSATKSLVSFYILGEKQAEAIKQSVDPLKEEMLLVPAGAKKMAKKEFPPLEMEVAPLDFRLVIPKIGKNVPLVKMSDEYISDDLWGKFEKEVQQELRKGVVHYPGTAFPGQNGNVFFTGHSSYYPWDPGKYKDVFANLAQLEVGDVYYVYFQQKKHTYKVFEKKEVRPSEVGVLEQSESKKLSTLMTCWPLGTALKRLIVVAEEV